MMTTENVITLIQMAVQSITLLSVPFVAAKLARTTPSPKPAETTPTKRINRVAFGFVIALMLFGVFALLRTSIRNAPLDAASVGAICLSVGVIVLGALLISSFLMFSLLQSQLQSVADLLFRTSYAATVTGLVTSEPEKEAQPAHRANGG